MQTFTDAELLALLDDLESDRVERKESFNGDVREKARQAVCAFANDLPGHNQAGVLFIGAKDNGAPSGLAVTDELLRNLADIKTDGKTLPLPTLSVEKRILKGVAVAVVTVMPSDMPPVRYEGRIWIRTGPRRSLANAQEERILNEKRRHKDLPFDLHPFPGAKISDLSKSSFENDYLPAAFAPEVLENNGRTYEEKLASCNLVAGADDCTPTVTGLLGIGKSPQDFLSGARIQFLRIAGKELADPVIDEEEIGGPLYLMLRRAEGKFSAHNQTSVDITSAATHRFETQYPSVAFLQILYNAVLHRSYEVTHAPVGFYWFDDRIEIHNPGGPYGRVTVDNFGRPGVVDYRNPNLATILKVFGFVQRYGRGIDTAKRAMRDNGNPEPEFRVETNNVVCILRRKP
jgi:ATP-dependent DNA helicase RecG